MTRDVVIACSALATQLFLTSSAPAAPVLPPGLHPGDHFYLAFVSMDARDATSASIATYNQFVQTEAALDPVLTGTDVGVAWHAIASTASTNAITNLGLSSGVPIFLLDGTTQVSVTDASGWVGATLQHAIDHDQFAAAVPGGGGAFAWTGTSSAGTTSTLPLGGGVASELGSVTGFVDSRWVDFAQAFSSQPLSLYAVSSLLILVTGDVNRDAIVNGQDIAVVASHWLATGSNAADANGDNIVNGQDIALVASNWLHTTAGGGGGSGAATVPEPSTLALAALGGLSLLAFQRRRSQAPALPWQI